VTSHQPRPGVATGIDTRTANPARIYDALLGGKDHYPVDRATAQAILKAAPQAREGARENRGFLQRAVRFLAEAGIRQFLDIGTGLPTQGNVHEIAHKVAPDARVVYVDNDPMVHTHALALLTNNRPSTVAVLADLRQPEAILTHPQMRQLLDLTRPVGVLLVAVLHFISDEENPTGIVARLREGMAPGSYLVISHATGDFHPQAGAKVSQIYRHASAPLVLRSRTEIERFFDGFDLVAPGLVQPAAWRPDPGPLSPSAGGFYSGVGQRRTPDTDRTRR
jgi:S-adenosyl methyltransferase